MAEEEDNTIADFTSDINNYYQNSIIKFKEYKNDPSKAKLDSYKKQFPHTSKRRLGKNTKDDFIKKSKIGIYDYLKLTDKRPEHEKKYSNDEVDN